MNKISAQLKLFLDLAKLQSVMTRKFDGKLGGLGLSEFVILFHLSQAEKQTMRRVDLAEKTGLTASGVTRLLLPMEKVGLVKRVNNPSDYRVSLVSLSSGGRRKLSEGLERAESFVQELLPLSKTREFGGLPELMKEMGA